MTIVVTDFLCNAGDAERNRRLDAASGNTVCCLDPRVTNDQTWWIASILDLLRKPENFARAGHNSVALFNRITGDDHFSMGHWYPDWRGQAG